MARCRSGRNTRCGRRTRPSPSTASCRSTDATTDTPGRTTDESSEVLAKYIIVDLFAKAVRGDSTQSVIESAERELKAIYEA